MTVLRELHDELDAAVADAYGWSADLPDEDILARLVTLNAERAEEEKQGKIRWLRPEYQTKSKAERQMIQTTLDIALPAEPVAKGKKSKIAKAAPLSKTPWPSDLLEQTQTVRDVVKALQDAGTAITLEVVAGCFVRAPRAKVEEILRVLEALGFV